MHLKNPWCRIFCETPVLNRAPHGLSQSYRTPWSNAFLRLCKIIYHFEIVLMGMYLKTIVTNISWDGRFNLRSTPKIHGAEYFVRRKFWIQMGVHLNSKLPSPSHRTHGANAFLGRCQITYSFNIGVYKHASNKSMVPNILWDGNFDLSSTRSVPVITDFLLRCIFPSV